MNNDDLAPVPYEYGAVAPPGSTLFTAGACPLDAAGVVVGPGDHRVQAERAVHNLLAVLARHGATAENLVRTTVYVVGTREDLIAVWMVIAKQLAPHRPAATLIGVTTLGYPDQLVEIDGVAGLSC